MTRVTQLFLPINVLYNSRENIELDGNLYCIHHPFSRNRFMALDMLGFFFSSSLVHTTMSTKFIRWWPKRLGLISIQLVVLRLYTLGPAAPSETNEKTDVAAGRFSLLNVFHLLYLSFSPRVSFWAPWIYYSYSILFSIFFCYYFSHSFFFWVGGVRLGCEPGYSQVNRQE